MTGGITPLRNFVWLSPPCSFRHGVWLPHWVALRFWHRAAALPKLTNWSWLKWLSFARASRGVRSGSPENLTHCVRSGAYAKAGTATKCAEAVSVPPTIAFTARAGTLRGAQSARARPSVIDARVPGTVRKTSYFRPPSAMTPAGGGLLRLPAFERGKKQGPSDYP